MLGWLKVAFVQATSGLWHEAHPVEDGCVAAHETPGFLWHVAHETVRVCPDGGVWHEAQAEEVWR